MAHVTLKLYYKGNGKMKKVEWEEKEPFALVKEGEETVKKPLTLAEYEQALHNKLMKMKEQGGCLSFKFENGEISIIDFGEIREITFSVTDTVTEIKEDEE